MPKTYLPNAQPHFSPEKSATVLHDPSGSPINQSDEVFYTPVLAGKEQVAAKVPLSVKYAELSADFSRLRAKFEEEDPRSLHSASHKSPNKAFATLVKEPFGKSSHPHPLDTPNVVLESPGTTVTPSSCATSQSTAMVSPAMVSKADLLKQPCFTDTSPELITPPKPSRNLASNLKAWHAKPSKPLTPNYAKSTAASERRAKIATPEPQKKKSDWGNQKTVPKTPNLRCVGKRTTLAAMEKKNQNNPTLPRATTLPRSLSKTLPKTPRVLRRSSGMPRRPPSPPVRKGFVPTPTPTYLTGGKLPEVKQTAKSMAFATRHLPSEKPPAPKPKVFTRPERTVPQPFELQGLSRHEEHMYEKELRQLEEQEEDCRRRRFRPVSLQKEILEGPTFVPSRSQMPLTQAVDLLPNAEERRERTLAFEAAQKERMATMEEMARIKRMQIEHDEEERLKREFEVKRFKPRSIPASHYKPDLGHLTKKPWVSPQKAEGENDDEDCVSTSEVGGEATVEEATVEEAREEWKSSEYNATSDEESDTEEVVEHESETPVKVEKKVSRASGLFAGLRDSLSPLLGRSSGST